MSLKKGSDYTHDPKTHLGFLAEAHGTIAEMRAMLPVAGVPIDTGPMADIADTARQLALRADEVGFVQISAAADAVEMTAGIAQTRKPIDRPTFALKIREQLKALEDRIRDDLAEVEPHIS